MGEKVLIMSKEEYRKMAKYFVKNNYTTSNVTSMGTWDLYFADFKKIKDIVLKHDTFLMYITNDYEKNISSLTVIEDTIKWDRYGKGVKHLTFTTEHDFCTELETYKKYLSLENGTIQALEWIIETTITKDENYKAKE